MKYHKVKVILKLFYKLEISFVSTHTYVNSEDIRFSTKALFADVSIYFAKNLHFLTKMVSLLKVIMWELCQRFFSSVFSICKVKGYIHGNVSFTNYASGIPDCSKLVVNRKNDNDVKICSHDVIIKFFDVILYLLSSLVTGPSFMSRSSLVLESWQFSSIGDWPENRKSKIPPSEFCPISGDWSKLGIPNLARMALRKCYWILQNTRVTAFTVSKLLRENQQWGKIIPPLPRQE